MSWVNANRKFLVAALGAVLAAVAAAVHKPIDDVTAQAIVGGIIAAAVWLVPNTPAPAAATRPYDSDATKPGGVS